MLGRLGILCVAAVVGAGCTPQPMSISKMPGPLTLNHWAAQDEATNIQDWHRMSKKVVEEVQFVGLLSSTNPIYVSADQTTPFVRELARAVRTEIIHRGGVVATSPARATVLRLNSDIVVWGSRLISDPSRYRSEGVWHATITSGDRMIMAVQDPFYFYASDIDQYAIVSAPPDPSLDLARSARPISYSR